MDELSPALQAIVKQIVAHSFEDLEGDYQFLTDYEKRLLTPEDFKTLLAWSAQK